MVSSEIGNTECNYLLPVHLLRGRKELVCPELHRRTVFLIEIRHVTAAVSKSKKEKPKVQSRCLVLPIGNL